MNKLSFTAGNKILALCFLFAFGTVMAEPQKHNFNIAPQSISDALKALAAELHIQIISDAEALKGKSRRLYAQ